MSSEEALSAFDELALLLEEAPELNETPSAPPEEPWHEKYLFDRYDWEGFDGGYAVVPLTRGYFAVVNKSDAAAVNRFRWVADIRFAPDGVTVVGLYAARRATSKECARGAPKHIYLHRFVAGAVYAGANVIVDHKSGHGLDNRKCNLRKTDQSGNIGNSRLSARSVHVHLQRGVKPVCSFNKSGAIKRITGYKGTIQVRGKKLYSKTIFRAPERAHRWYVRMHKLLFPGRDSWSGIHTKPLLFPPEQKALHVAPPLDTSIPF